jgi:threonine/homoserine/homoserine lactone efflux protein
METLWLFTLLAFGIMVVPGMDMAFVLSSALARGRQAGLAAVAGMVAGGAVHVVMGTLGVGVVLQLFPAAFNAVLAAGAAYVGWMGWSLWRSPATLGGATTSAPAGFAPTFLRATATCLLNPKAYLFMVAVFPQFLRPDQGPVLPQAVVLGAIIATAQATVYGGVAVGASGLRATLARSASAQAALSRTVAALLMAIAAWSLLHAWRT